MRDSVKKIYVELFCLFRITTILTWPWFAIMCSYVLHFFFPNPSALQLLYKNKIKSIWWIKKKRWVNSKTDSNLWACRAQKKNKKRITILSRSIWSDLHNQTRRACIPFTGNWWRFKTRKTKKKKPFSFCPFGLHPNDEIERHCVCWGCDLVGYWHKCQIQMIIKWVRRTVCDHSMT